MILTRLAGGMGNQLFQYAAGRSLAARLGVELVLDSSWIEGAAGTGPGTKRRFWLDPFELPYALVSARRVARLPPLTRRESVVHRWVPTRKPTVSTLVESSQPALDARIFTAPDDTCLQGFWQSERYFAEHADIVRRELGFPPANGHIAQLEREIDSSAAVSVHVRRGDRAMYPAAGDRFVALTPAWYEGAVRELAQRDESIESAYVFSDDPAWCHEHLSLPCRTTVIENNSELDDLRLMSRCRHHVIANSTFSWWGAWLDPRPDKLVVAPGTRRNDRELPDAVPAGWITLSA